MTVQFRGVHYTTLDRRDTFTFDFVQVSNYEWRAYIVSEPSYGERAQGAHESHRLHDSRGHYVCWAPAPRTLNEAKGAARAWADATQVYIRRGRVPAPAGPRFVPDLSTSVGSTLSDHVGSIPAAATPVLPPPGEQIPASQSTNRATGPTASQPSSIRVTTSRPAGLRGLFTRRTR